MCSMSEYVYHLVDLSELTIMNINELRQQTKSNKTISCNLDLLVALIQHGCAACDEHKSKLSQKKEAYFGVLRYSITLES